MQYLTGGKKLTKIMKQMFRHVSALQELLEKEERTILSFIELLGTIKAIAGMKKGKELIFSFQLEIG